jgi:hypothetical protein
LILNHIWTKNFLRPELLAENALGRYCVAVYAVVLLSTQSVINEPPCFQKAEFAQTMPKVQRMMPEEDATLTLGVFGQRVRFYIKALNFMPFYAESPNG